MNRDRRDHHPDNLAVYETALDERTLARLGHLSDRFFASDAVETEMIHFAR